MIAAIMGAPGALATDLYQLTMMQAYFDEGLEDTAVFDLYVRALPPERRFLVACGLESCLEYLEALSFSPDDLAHLESLGLFSARFLQRLESFRFAGSVRAMPEGTLAFEREPLLSVEAPLPQAQLVETYVQNQVSFQTMVASKGARVVLAARGRGLSDFGSRRAHGWDAALKAARALYIAGYDSTSNVEAGRIYGIPVAGTMAHSYVQAHADEAAAFRAFLRSYPETILLVDTYDTLEGVREVIRLASEVPGLRVRGVRLDSGDIAALARETRRLLNEAGLYDVRVFVSGGMDEHEIDLLLRSDAPVDAFGVGTNVVTSADAPKLDTAYKLVEYAGKARIKLSPEKATLPGRKQVFRRYEDGAPAEDVLALDGENAAGEPLLVEVMSAGERTAAGRAPLSLARERARRALAELPRSLRGLESGGERYAVTLSPGLLGLERTLRDRRGQT